MIAPRLLPAASLGCLLSLAGAASAGAPPPGWEAPPPLPAKASGKTSGRPALPACCAYDSTCCTRQLSIDGATVDRVDRVVEVDVATLPALAVREGADLERGPRPPRLLFFDGAGRPAHWPDGPKDEVRAVPPGRFGAMTWGSGWEWGPFWNAPALRHLGWGLVRNMNNAIVDSRALLTGKVTFVSFDQGEGDAITVDYVYGTLEGAPDLVVGSWAHVEAAHVVDGVVHAFRGWGPRDGDPQEAAPRGTFPEPVHEGEAVTFVLPAAFVEFESKDATHTGGVGVSHGFRLMDDPYGALSLPVGPGRSGLVRCEPILREPSHWLPLPGGSRALPSGTRILLSSSQTTAEPTPRVRVVFFAS